MGVSRRAAAVSAAIAIGTAAAGCGGSSSPPPVSGKTVAAVCAQTSAQLAAIAHRRILRHAGGVIIAGPSKPATEREREVEAALSEDAGVYAAAIPAVRHLKPTPAASNALTRLEETAQRIRTLRSELAKHEGGPDLIFAVFETSGGCRKLRAPIGG